MWKQGDKMLETNTSSVFDEYQKWRHWTMMAKKQQPNLALLTSAIVLVTATLVLSTGATA